MRTSIIAFISLVIALTLGLQFASAAVTLPSDLHPENAPTITGKKPTGTAPEEVDPDKARIAFTQKIVNILLTAAGVVAIFFIINNAWFMIASGGKEEIITQHKKGLMWAIVGLLLIIFSYTIIRFIISIPFQAHEEEPAAAPGTSQSAQAP